MTEPFSPTMKSALRALFAERGVTMETPMAAELLAKASEADTLRSALVYQSQQVEGECRRFAESLHQGMSFVMEPTRSSCFITLAANSASLSSTQEHLFDLVYAVFGREARTRFRDLLEEETTSYRGRLSGQGGEK